MAEKNLGVLWLVTEDKLQVKPLVSYTGSKRKGDPVSLVPFLDYIHKLIPLKLSMRDCLSVHTKCFDPLGLLFTSENERQKILS